MREDIVSVNVAVSLPRPARPASRKVTPVRPARRIGQHPQRNLHATRSRRVRREPQRSLGSLTPNQSCGARIIRVTQEVML